MSRNRSKKIVVFGVIGLMVFGALTPLISVVASMKQEKEMEALYQEMLLQALEEADKEESATIDCKEEHEHTEECEVNNIVIEETPEHQHTDECNHNEEIETTDSTNNTENKNSEEISE